MSDENFDLEIRRKIQSLDDCYPDTLHHPEIIWQKIQAARKNNSTRKIRWMCQAAASFTLIITASIIWRLSDSKEQIKNNKPDYEMATTAEREALEYINKFCGDNSLVCNSPAFKELEYELTESTSALTEINNQIKIFGSNAGLLKAQARIKNHQNRVINAMVQSL